MKHEENYYEEDELGMRIYPIQPNTYLKRVTGRQTVELFRNAMWGRMLFLDGVLQSATRDEYLYHCALVSGLEKKGRILLLGGAEGATVRELLKSDAVTGVTMVDWDEELVNLMRQESDWKSIDVWADERLEVIHEDVFTWLPAYAMEGSLYDEVVVDLLDPDISTEREGVFWTTLLLYLKEVVRRGGRVVMNAGRVLPWDDTAFRHFYRLVKAVFTADDWFCEYSQVFVPSFGSEWAFIQIKGFS